MLDMFNRIRINKNCDFYGFRGCFLLKNLHYICIIKCYLNMQSLFIISNQSVTSPACEKLLINANHRRVLMA